MNTVQVALTQGYVAVIDAADAHLVLAHRWHVRPSGRTVYAQRGVQRPDGTWRKQALHQFLTGYAITDHINGDGLDNRRSNLREVTAVENGRNRRRDRDNTSGFKGVCWHKRDRKWQAGIRDGGKSPRHLGYFSTAEEAAHAYDAAAREMHGEYATLNFPAAGERAA